LHAWIVHDSFQQRHGKGNRFSFSNNHEDLDNSRFGNSSIYVNFIIVHGGIGVSPLILIPNYSKPELFFIFLTSNKNFNKETEPSTRVLDLSKR